MASNLTKRLIVAAVGIPVLMGVIYYGGGPLYLFCLLVSLLGSWELAAMLLSKKIEISKRIITFLPIFIVSAVQFSWWQQYGFLIPFLLMFLIAYMIISATSAENYYINLSSTMLAVIYPSFFISFAILTHREFAPYGWIILLFVFANTWLADTFAYSFGKWFGKAKLAPRVSPNKTWVGFFAGFLGGIIAALLAYIFLSDHYTIFILILASLAATFFGQIGDLIESAIKRDCGIKDSSNLIPGHGGILDRFDSLFFAIPAVYFILTYFG